MDYVTFSHQLWRRWDFMLFQVCSRKAGIGIEEIWDDNVVELLLLLLIPTFR